ncbi:MAG TPA: cell division protein FtsZ, partial [Blastocatellia bacterium]|nr:cell division protein FtsZ [Blastocatellia bacterium]
TGGMDLTLFEVNEAMSIIHDQADQDANIIFGAVLDERLTDEMKITVIATGFEKVAAATEPLRTFSTAHADRPTGSDGRGSGLDMSRRDDLNVPAFIRKKAD